MATGRVFDLEKRTAVFGENVIKFAKTIPKTHITTSLITQFVKSGTSIGANYCEADDAESRNDFIHKLGIAKKEARETMHWLRMIVIAAPESKITARILWKEAKELNLILNSIVKKTRIRSKTLEISN